MSEANDGIVIVHKYLVVTKLGGELTVFSKRNFVDFSSFVMGRLTDFGLVSFRKDPNSAASDGDVHAVFFGGVDDLSLMEIVETIRVQA